MNNCPHKQNEFYDEVEPCAKCFEEQEIKPFFKKILDWIKWFLGINK